MAATLVATSLAGGCSNEDDLVRDIQMDRQRRLTQETNQDDLREAFSYLTRLVELNGEQAERQIVFHLNRWLEERNADIRPGKLPEIFGTLPSSTNAEALAARYSRPVFVESDVPKLLDQHLMQKMVQWIDESSHEDPLLTSWFDKLDASIPQAEVRKLRTASRLFDWTVRNITYRPASIQSPIQPPELPNGLEYLGPGYRQTPYQTLQRGSGDALQRMNVFVSLCRQAEVDAFVVAVNPKTAAQQPLPWAAAVLVAGEAYLFDFEVGMFVPSAGDEVAIATLKEARRDAQVLRRMKVPGFFDYPFAKSDIQSCVALVPLLPEAVSERFVRLQKALTGDRRMVTAVEIEALAERIDATSGISGVRLWDIPLRCEEYELAMERAADRDAQVAQVHRSQWLMLDGEIPGSQGLALGRWRHLTGQFDDNVGDDIRGARSLFLEQRSPEFEIEDLRTDVNLQKKYDVRRQLGMDNEQYDRMIEIVKTLIRSSKRTATYWLSLIQYEDTLYDNAESWIEKRVLDEEQSFVWEQAARYNLARTAEKQGEIERAIELHKTRGLPTEHGSRLRARLLQRQFGESDSDKEPKAEAEAAGAEA